MPGFGDAFYITLCPDSFINTGYEDALPWYPTNVKNQEKDINCECFQLYGPNARHKTQPSCKLSSLEPPIAFLFGLLPQPKPNFTVCFHFSYSFYQLSVSKARLSALLLPGCSWLITQEFSISHFCFSSFYPSSNFSLLGIILIFLPPNSKSQVSLSLFQLLVTICYLQLLFHNLIPCTSVFAQFHTNPPHSVVQATDGWDTENTEIEHCREQRCYSTLE